MLIYKNIFILFFFNGVTFVIFFPRNSDLVSTTENVALVIYEKVAALLPEGIQLYSIKIHETDKNIVEFRGEFL